MKIWHWKVDKQVFTFIILALIWYILGFTSYDVYKILPNVKMGEYHSWPLYFFLIDIFATFGLIIFYGRIVWTNRKSKHIFFYILLGLLLIYPLLIVHATYDDLYSSFCLKLDPINYNCLKYRPPPDFRNISLE